MLEIQSVIFGDRMALIKAGMEQTSVAHGEVGLKV